VTILFFSCIYRKLVQWSCELTLLVTIEKVCLCTYSSAPATLLVPLHLVFSILGNFKTP